MQERISSVGGSKARLENGAPGEFQNWGELLFRLRFTHPEFSRMMIPSTDMIQSWVKSRERDRAATSGPPSLGYSLTLSTQQQLTGSGAKELCFQLQPQVTPGTGESLNGTNGFSLFNCSDISWRVQDCQVLILTSQVRCSYLLTGNRSDC